MDTISHLVWGQLIVREPELFLATALVSNLPDLVGWVPLGIYNSLYHLRVFKHASRNNKKRYRLIETVPLPKKAFQDWYHLTHSLPAWGVFIWILEIFWPQYRILSLAYLGHIILDVPFHTGRWSMKPLFPFSDFAIKGQYFWQKQFVILNVISYALARLFIR